jgi:hypothetical protein
VRQGYQREALVRLVVFEVAARDFSAVAPGERVQRAWIL